MPPLRPLCRHARCSRTFCLWKECLFGGTHGCGPVSGVCAPAAPPASPYERHTRRSHPARAYWRNTYGAALLEYQRVSCGKFPSPLRHHFAVRPLCEGACSNGALAKPVMEPKAPSGRYARRRRAAAEQRMMQQRFVICLSQSP